MTDFQIVLVDLKETPAARGSDMAVEQQSRAVDKSLDKLDDLWDATIARLHDIVARTGAAADKFPFEIDTIEFNVGVETGVMAGIVAKGQAGATITFKRKTPGDDGTA